MELPPMNGVFTLENKTEKAIVLAAYLIAKSPTIDAADFNDLDEMQKETLLNGLTILEFHCFSLRERIGQGLEKDAEFYKELNKLREYARRDDITVGDKRKTKTQMTDMIFNRFAVKGQKKCNCDCMGE